MPYGMPKGMDTQENNAKMERCVAEVMKDGHSKQSAIKICKASMIKANALRNLGGKKNG